MSAGLQPSSTGSCRARATHRPLRRQLPHPVRCPDERFLVNGYFNGQNDHGLDDCLRYCIVSGKKALENAGRTPRFGHCIMAALGSRSRSVAKCKIDELGHNAMK
ncbi:unnamed protein product [Urochloa humidicola]